TVTANAPGTGIPSGTVSFRTGKSVLGTVALDSTGHASFTTSTLPGGATTVFAVYSGNGNFLTSRGSVVQQVNTNSTMTRLTSSLNPSTFGQPVTFTATVTAQSGTPTGNVTFKDGATTLATVALNGSGVAAFTTSTLAIGRHKIIAVYAGNSSFGGSTS